MRRRFLSTNKRPVRYMTVEPLENGVYLSFGGDGLYYSIDDSEWVSLPSDTNTPSINVGQTIKIKGLNVRTNSMHSYFTINGRCKLSGTIMSIIYGDNPYEEKLPFDGCFSGAFYNCTSIVSVAPDFLPATTLTKECYYEMFYGCTSLTTAPEFPATTLASYCYQYMFYGCSKLNYIKMLATDISATDCLLGWVYNVASTGTFVKNPNMTSLPTGDSGIPSGWTVVNDGEESGGGNEITFYIDDQAYATPMTALSNMTWGEFVNSEYANQNGMFTNFRLVGQSAYDVVKFYHEEVMQDMYICTSHGNEAKATDVIEDGKTYEAW